MPRVCQRGSGTDAWGSAVDTAQARPGEIGEAAGQDLGALEVELALRAEVLVEDGLGDARGLGHVVHRGAVEAAGSEELEGHVEQLAAATHGGKAGHGEKLPYGNKGQEPITLRGHSTAEEREPGTVTANDQGVAHPKRAAPDRGARRPPEPLRPSPARRRMVGLLEV